MTSTREVDEDSAASVAGPSTIDDASARSWPGRVGSRTAARRAFLPTAAQLEASVLIPTLLIAGLLVAAVFPSLLAPFGPLDIDPAQAFSAPSGHHWFGTDDSGRDVFSRVIHGTRSSLLIGLFATVVGLGLGVILGTIAGLGGRALDFGVSRLLEVLFAFPSLLLALLTITILGPGVVSTTLAVGISTAPGYARLIRTQVLSVRRSGYVEAATVLGRSGRFVTFRHVLPNVAAPLFVLATLGIGQAIVWASSLSFLGLGTTPPDPEWGSMLSVGRRYLANAWWLTVFPGLFIVFSAAATTVLGHTLQRRLKDR